MRNVLVGLLLTIAAITAHGAEGDLVQVGQKAPPVEGITSDGNRLEAKSLKGKVVLLDFFATWCGPCMAEMPQVERELWQRYQNDGLMIVAVGRQHTVDELRKFKESKHYGFTILSDPKREIYERYATKYIPRYYIVGKDGVVKYAATGGDPDQFGRMKEIIEAELKRGNAKSY